MTVSLIVVFFLPQIPLRKSDHRVMEDVGVKLQNNFGQSDHECQPRIIAVREKVNEEFNKQQNEKHRIIKLCNRKSYFRNKQRMLIREQKVAIIFFYQLVHNP